jgi:hypothetical protein
LPSSLAPNVSRHEHGERKRVGKLRRFAGPERFYSFPITMDKTILSPPAVK